MSVNAPLKFSSKGSGQITITKTGAGGREIIAAGGIEANITDLTTSVNAKVDKAGDTMTGALVIDGSANAVQLKAQGHSTQSANIFEIEDSGGNDQVTVSSDGAVVINEEGNDADFRVESDGDANALYVDASANTVQVGAATASDSAKFYVAGKISLSGELEANGDLNHDGSNIGFFTVTPVARAGATDDIKDALTTYGLLQGASASPLNLDGGTLICGEANPTGNLNHDGSNVGFYGVTPAARPTAYTQTYLTATRTHSNLTASTLTDSSGGTANTTIQALTDPADLPLTADALRDDLVANLIPELRNNYADLAAQVNALIVDLANAKQVLNQVVDDMQSNGLLQ